jgi:hypothetical protein
LQLTVSNYVPKIPSPKSNVPKIQNLSSGVYSGVSGVVSGALVTTNSTVSGAISGAAGGAAAGATAGGMSAAIYDGDIGQGMLRGAGLGAVGGAAFGGIGGYFGKAWNMYRVGAYGLAGGGVSELAGQGFEKGAIIAGAAAFARFAYNEMVHYDADCKPGGAAVAKGRFDMPVEGANNIGIQTKPVNHEGLFYEGGPVSRAANCMPGINATGGMHDVFQVKLDEFFGGQALGNFMRSTLNVPAMLPAAVFSYGALMADPRAMILYSVENRRD